MRRDRRPCPSAALAAAIAACAGGCHRGETTATDGGVAAVPEPIIPAVMTSADVSAAPAWAERLPQTAPTVTRGDRVWAVPPQPGSEMADAAIYTVESAYEHALSLTDKMGQRADGVPAAVVHLAGTTPKLAEGDIVLCYAFTLPGVLGRVTKLQAGEEIRVLYDWAGTTKEAAIYHAEAPRRGVVPLAFVGFPKAGATSIGLLVALSDGEAWVRTSSGHIEVHSRTRVEALPLPPSTLSVGASVRAYSWGTGLLHGAVTAIAEPGLRYRVKPQGELPEQDYFFSAVIPSR